MVQQQQSQTQAQEAQSQSQAPRKKTKSRSGCVTCKKRRLKCDETKPTCLECARRKVQCGGYAKNFKWRSFEETNVCAKINKQNGTKPRSLSTTEDKKIKTDSEKSIESLIHAAAAMVSANGSDKREAQIKKPPPSSAVVVGGNHASGNSIAPGAAAASSSSGTSGNNTTVTGNSNNTHEFSAASSPDLRDFVNNILPNDFSNGNNGNISPTFSAIFNGMNDDNSNIITLPSPKDLDMLEMKTPPGGTTTIMSPLVPPSTGGGGSGGGGQPHPQLLGSDKEENGDDQSTTSSSSIGALIMPQQTQYAWGNDRLQGWLADFLDTSNSTSPPFLANLNNIVAGAGTVPRHLMDSHEQTFKLYDRYTCGILSIKDGPTENPWRTVMWPLAQDYGALYHAVAAMTKFHTARTDPDLRSQAMHHMKESFHLLSSGLSNRTIPPDIALATTLSLAFAEAWDRHISTGIAHLRGAAAMLKQLLKQHRNEPLPPWLQFLFNSWLYLDVCARLTADSSEEAKSIIEVSDGEDGDDDGAGGGDDDQDQYDTVQMLLDNDVFDDTSSEESFNSSSSPGSQHQGKLRRNKRKRRSSSMTTGHVELKENLFLGQRDEVDPLLGCAQTLFPIIGKVAALVQKVRKCDRNTLSIVSEAVELKHQLETWNASLSRKMTYVEDPTWDLNSCLATAEAYRYASLLYLHQAVPEVPSLSSHELAEKVMMLLASIPTSSRTSVVHIFPLLIAGCEANGEEREWVRERWRTLSERMWIGNVDRTVEIVKEVWLRKDQSRKHREYQRQQRQKQQQQQAHANQKDGLQARRSSRDIASSIASRVSQAFGGSSLSTDESDSDDEGIKGYCHWSVVMREWGWEVLLG